MQNRIAITFNGADCLRIIPISTEREKAEIKFHFFDESFTVRKFEENKSVGGLIYFPVDHGQAEHEITYHNSNKNHQNPVILPKNKSGGERVPISSDIINLYLKNLIVPIPICRITTNVTPDKVYQGKDQHSHIALTEEYNTTDIYIAHKDYNSAKMAKRYPMIANFLFPITTIDFMVYGSGMSAEPIFNKMFKKNNPVQALQSSKIGNYQFFYRTYRLVNTDDFRMYSNKEYNENNFIEFFNNIAYLDLLATTNIAYKTLTKTTTPKSAYEYDIENLRKIGTQQEFLAKLERQFSRKKRYYEKLKKIRSGILIRT